MALSQVAFSSTRQSGTTSPAVTITSSTSGSLLALSITGRSGLGAATVSSVTDNLGQTWLQCAASRATDSGNNGFIDNWYFPNSASGVTTVTATLNMSNSDIYMAVWEVGGAATASPQDGNGAVLNDQSGAATGAAITTTNADDFICGTVFTTANVGGGTGGSFTSDNNDTSGAVYTRGASHRIVAATGTYTPSWTGNSNYCAATVAFKAASGGGGSTVRPRSLLTLGCGC